MHNWQERAALVRNYIHTKRWVIHIDTFLVSSWQVTLIMFAFHWTFKSFHSYTYENGIIRHKRIRVITWWLYILQRLLHTVSGWVINAFGSKNTLHCFVKNVRGNSAGYPRCMCLTSLVTRFCLNRSADVNVVRVHRCVHARELIYTRRFIFHCYIWNLCQKNALLGR